MRIRFIAIVITMLKCAYRAGVFAGITKAFGVLETPGFMPFDG